MPQLLTEVTLTQKWSNLSYTYHGKARVRKQVSQIWVAHTSHSTIWLGRKKSRRSSFHFDRLPVVIHLEKVKLFIETLNPFWLGWATLISWMKTVNLPLPRRSGTIFKVTGVLLLLQLQLINFTAISDSCGAWGELHGRGKKMKNELLCMRIIHIFIFQFFFRRSSLATSSGRKAPSFKILQSISCLITSDRNPICKSGKFFLTNISKKEALWFHKC